MLVLNCPLAVEVQTGAISRVMVCGCHESRKHGQQEPFWDV